MVCALDRSWGVVVGNVGAIMNMVVGGVSGQVGVGRDGVG